MWHRNEISGALSGLTRVRKFVQDDAHIFCTPDQVRLGSAHSARRCVDTVNSCPSVCAHPSLRCARQVQREVASVLQMVRDVYEVFGFTFELALSTRPAKFIGSTETWDLAENALRQGTHAWRVGGLEGWRAGGRNVRKPAAGHALLLTCAPLSYPPSVPPRRWSCPVAHLRPTLQPSLFSSSLLSLYE